MCRRDVASELSIPTDWRNVRFEEFVELQRGQDLPRSQFQIGSVPVGGSNGIIGFHNTANVSGPGITVGRSGSVGTIVGFDSDFWAHNTVLFVKQFHENDVGFTRFCLQFLNLGRFASGVAVPTLNRNTLRNLPVLLPPISEQRQIAAVLNFVQHAIEQQEQLIALTTELKKAVMHRLFTEGVHGESQKLTEIGVMPESWGVIPLGQAFKTQLGKMLSKKAKVGPAPKLYLRNKNVQWGHFDLSDVATMDFSDREMEKFRLERGDLLICEGGVVGRAAIWDGQISECFYQKALHRLRPASNEFSNPYLAYWLYYSFELRHLYGVSGARSTIAHLPEVQLKTLLIPQPSRSEQDELVARLSSLDRTMAVTMEKLATLRELFRTLLHSLMTAQLRVSELDLSVLDDIARSNTAR